MESKWFDWHTYWAVAKRLVASKTVWFNGFIVPSMFVLEQNFHMFYEMLGPKTYPIAFAAICAINVFLRMSTERAHMASLPPVPQDDYNADAWPKY